MIERRITFVLPEDGFASWKLNRLKVLGGMFRSVIMLVNVTRQKMVNAEQSLQVMALGGQQHDLCQLHIEGSDAELACMVMTDFVSEQFTLVNTAHKSNAKTNIALLRQLPTFSLPFTLHYHYEKLSHHFDHKIELLAEVAKQVKPEGCDALLEELVTREKVSSTAIGHGIALPHLITDQVTQPELVVYKLPEPLDWQSKLGKTELVIALLLPKPPQRDMLISITSLTRWLLNPEYCQLLTSSREPEAIKALLIHRLAQGHWK